jgi:hypothetical protein
MASEYQAGVCNIGKEEIHYRKKVVGYGSAVVGTALYMMLAFFDVPILLYLLMMVPIFISVHGFNESKHRFCTSYARAGKYNMASEVGFTQDVISSANRKKDRAYASKLLNRSIKISLVLTALLMGLSRILS